MVDVTVNVVEHGSDIASDDVDDIEIADNDSEGVIHLFMSKTGQCSETVEITPEMVLEGAAALSRYSESYPEDVLLSELYRAMRRLEGRVPASTESKAIRARARDDVR